MASKLFAGATITGKDGKAVDASAALDGKIVGIYFSAHWCPPCRAFTPKLAGAYNEHIANGKPFEIVFVSSDEDEGKCREYYASMPWKLLSYSDRATKDELNSLYNVQGIPTLVLVNAEGELITKEGRARILTTEFDDLAALKGAAGSGGGGESPKCNIL